MYTNELPKSLMMAHLAAIVESSDDAIISKTLEGIITSWNEAAERMFGYTAAEAIGMPILMLIPEDRLDEEPAIVNRLKKGERVDHFETIRITKDRRLLNISLTISPIKDERGRIVGASKVARNITEQREAERQIRENEERFRMAVESTRLGTWEFNPMDGALVWSEECYKIYAVPADVPIDFSLFENHIYPDDKPVVKAAIEAALDPAGKGTYDIRYRILRYSDHQVRWIRAQGKVYFGDNNKALRFIGTVLDITDEQMAQTELERLVDERTAELKKKNAELEQYAYIASHDLQEPLRKIQLYAELLKNKAQDPAAVATYYEKINITARRMSVLIKDVLNYSKLSQVETLTDIVNLEDVLKEVLVDFDLLIAEKNATITADPLPLIRGDWQQLKQLFGNLFSNSLKFCEGPPVIHVSCAIIERPLRVQLIFRDNGIGFDQQYAGQVFMGFKRLNNRQLYSGTGIGLALCKKIVERHGGTIEASSKPGVGTSFTIFLPLHQ
jgi:PAS domain S-box-containing protein